MRVTAGDVVAIGPGKVALLEAIAAGGSITEGSKRMGMSYRRAWLLVEEINHALREPAVDSAKGGQHGGGSALTDTGQHVVELYRRIEHTAEAACAADLRELLSMLARR